MTTIELSLYWLKRVWLKLKRLCVLKKPEKKVEKIAAPDLACPRRRVDAASCWTLDAGVPPVGKDHA